MNINSRSYFYDNRDTTSRKRTNSKELNSISSEVNKLQKRLSYKERRADALALRADEGRNKLRKASGRCK